MTTIPIWGASGGVPPGTRPMSTGDKFLTAAIIAAATFSGGLYSCSKKDTSKSEEMYHAKVIDDGLTSNYMMSKGVYQKVTRILSGKSVKEQSDLLCLMDLCDSKPDGIITDEGVSMFFDQTVDDLVRKYGAKYRDLPDVSSGIKHTRRGYTP